MRKLFLSLAALGYLLLFTHCKKEDIELVECTKYFEFHTQSHLNGQEHATEANAYDLVLDEQKEAGFEDLEQTDMLKVEGEYNSWRSGEENSTLFVKANQLNFLLCTPHQAKEAFESGNSSKYVNSVYIGDIYVARLRNTDQYAVIEIDQIMNPDGCIGGCLGPTIYFSYKK